MSLLWFLLALLGPAVAIATWFALDTSRAYARITGNSTVVPSPLGDIEFKREGAGIPVLVVHGSGGGFDQGELIATAILGEGFDWIAPSRFGYLCSTFREGATFDDQKVALLVVVQRPEVGVSDFCGWLIGFYLLALAAGTVLHRPAGRDTA